MGDVPQRQASRRLLASLVPFPHRRKPPTDDMDTQDFDRTAARQHGLVTFAQLLALGLSTSAIERLEQRGRIARVHRGVYRIVGSPTSWRQAVMAAVLAAGDETYAAHRTAAALHPLFRTRGGIIEILSEHERSFQRSGARSHRTRDLPAVDRWVIDNIPVTAVNRTLIDVGRYWPVGRVWSLLDHAVRDELTTYDAFESRVHALARQGRNGIGTAREVLLRVGLDGTWGFERAMRHALRDAGLPKPTREFRVDVGLNRYYVDFAYPEARLGIECDSTEWHTLPSQVAAGMKRTNHINGSGFLLLSYSSSALRDDPDAVAAEIARHLRERSPAA